MVGAGDDTTLKLLSIHLPSNKPFFFRRLVENLRATAADPGCFEVVVKIDTDDGAMARCIEEIRRDLEVNLTVVVSPPPESYFHTYIAYNEVLAASDPGYYFCWHVNDEVLLETARWDEKLARYVGFFPDHMFRLKVNPAKMFHNFAKVREACLYADYPIVTRRWLDAVAVWSYSHGPETYQEAVAIYLGRLGYHRNVPLLDIRVGGDPAGENLSAEATLRRERGTCLAWDRSLAPRMHEKFHRGARHVQLRILASELGLERYEIRENDARKFIELVAGERVHARVWYSVDSVRIWLENLADEARRDERVWRFSLWGKPRWYRAAIHARRALDRLRGLAIALVAVPLGIALGRPVRAVSDEEAEAQVLLRETHPALAPSAWMRPFLGVTRRLGRLRRRAH